MPVRQITVMILLFVTQQCAVGGMIFGDSDIEHRLSVESVAEFMNTGDSQPIAISQRSGNDLGSCELPGDASATTIAAPPGETTFVVFVSNESLSVFDLSPPPNPELDGLIKPPEYTGLRLVFSVLV